MCNFREVEEYELRRIPLPRTPVNKEWEEDACALPPPGRSLLNEKLGPVLASNGPQLLHLVLARRDFRRGRQGALLGRLAGGVDELLEARRREQEQQLCRPRLHGVAVRDVFGTEEERSGGGLHRLRAHLERQFTLENPEAFVFAVVDVERLLALGLDHLDEGVAPVGLLARGLDGGQAAHPPPRFSLAFPEPEGPARGAIVLVHRPLLSLVPAGLLLRRRRTDDLAPVPSLENREALRLGLVARVFLVRKALRLGWRHGERPGRPAYR